MPKKHTRRRKSKRGGDIESGNVEDVTPMKSVPPDPERFAKYHEQMLKDNYKPMSNEKVAAVFEGPTPEQKRINEQTNMSNEDPLNKDPFDREELNIFSSVDGGRRNRKRRTKRRRTHKSRRNKSRRNK